MESGRRKRLGLVVLALIMMIGAAISLLSPTETAGPQLVPVGLPHRSGQYTLADPLTTTVSVTIAADSYYYTYSFCSENLGLYGDLDVDGGLQIEFFICDWANFELWTDGYAASAYVQNERVSSLEWTFKVPKTDRWYIIYANQYYLNDSVYVAGHLYLDTTPPVIEWNIEDGAACSGIKDIAAAIKEETFDVASVRLSIDDSLVDIEYDEFLTYSWNTEDVDDGIHAIRIEADDSIGNTAYLSAQVTVDNAEPYLSLFTPASIPMMISAAVGVLGVTAAVLVFATRPKTRIQSSTAPDLYPAYMLEPASRPQPSPRAKPCPYCGTPVVLDNGRFCPRCGTSVDQQ